MSFVDHLLGCAFTIGFRGSGLARSAGQVAAVFGKLAGVGACAQATCCQGERKQVMAEPKVVGKVSDAAAPASAVQAVEQVKVREAEAEVKVKEEEEEGECSVDELLDQHQELLDGMLSEVTMVGWTCCSLVVSSRGRFGDAGEARSLRCVAIRGGGGGGMV